MNRVATSLDTGFDPNATTKEWLEQVINSRIQRKIDGIRINPVELKSIHPGRVAYVVYVPQSVRAPHQASDKKFYKRYNFESVPMEEYEIRDVARRLTMPILRLELEMSAVPDQPDGTCDLLAVIVNESPEAALYAIVDIWFEETFTVQRPGSPGRVRATLRSIGLMLGVRSRKNGPCSDGSDPGRFQTIFRFRGYTLHHA